MHTGSQTEGVLYVLKSYFSVHSIYFIYRVVYTYYSTRHIGLHSIWMMWRNCHAYTAEASGRVFERTMPSFNTVNELAEIVQLHSRPVNYI